MKADKELGFRVHEHLKNLGLETPMNQFADISSDEYKIERITHHVSKIMEVLGLDLGDDSLIETPNRVAKMYVHELFRGLDYSHFPKCTTIENKMDSGMVTTRKINLMSSCEHHLLTIAGFATIAYIPKDRVMGLSKFNRIVKFFSQRPQVQERLTNQIWHSLNYILGTDDIAVYVDAEHFCVKARGISDMNSSTVTNKLGGVFSTDAACRNEFMMIASK